MFSRNSASSRAIPTSKILEMIKEDPTMPIYWGKNKKGMSASKEIEDKTSAASLWLNARDEVILYATKLYELGLHKQIANRILEPWQYITVICTATEWSNFYGLRRHADAQPEIHYLADLMFDAHKKSKPVNRAWHIPYIQDDEQGLSTDIKCEIGTARCARVSFLTHNGTRDIDKDRALYQRLMTGSGVGHWCYDEQTEVMTDCGWKYWKDITNKSFLASYNPCSGEINFENPIRLFIKEYTGDMFKVCGQSIDLLVTPEHRMLVMSRRNGGVWSSPFFTEARNLISSPVKYIKSGFLADRKEIYNPWSSQISTENFCKFIGFFIGDGHSSSRNTVQFNLKRQRKIDFLYSLELPVKKASGNKYIVTLDDIGKWTLENCFQGGFKKIPNDFIFAHEKEISFILEGLKNSDGSVKRNTWTYSSCSKILVDQIQMVLHMNLKSCNIKNEIRELPHNNKYIINVSDRIFPSVEPNQKNRSRTYNVEFTKYIGKIYCAEVSTGALVVRRNGKVVISGNSPFEHIARAAEKPRFKSGNFVGWEQYRKMFEKECIK
jgi:hypothetical protein